VLARRLQGYDRPVHEEDDEPPPSPRSRIEDVFAAIEGALEAPASLESSVPPLREPSLTRFYETNCVDLPGSGAAEWIISIPTPAYLAAAWQTDESMPWGRASNVALDLGFPETRDLRSADLLIPAILATRPDRAPTFAGRLHEEERAEYTRAEHLLQDAPDWARFVRLYDERLYLFAVRLAYEPLVPVEESPLSATSLAKLAGSTGASAALCLAGEKDPLLLVATPIAIVVLGAATGVAAGLHEALRRNVIRWLTGSDPGSGND
jgi:hypothetical protein